MFFAWSGKGFSIILVYILSALIFSVFFPGDSSGYPVAAAAFFTAAFSWYFGIKWNSEKRKIVIDEESGERYEIKNEHSLFWIKMEYWSIIASLFGIYVLSKKSLTLAVIASIVFIALLAYVFIQRRKNNEVYDEETYQTIQASEKEETE